MERYWMAKKALLNIPVVDGALPSDTFTQVVLYADAQRALDAEREKVKRLSTCGTDHSTPWWQVKCEDLEAQLATLQAQLRQVEGERADWKKAADDEPSAIYLGQLKFRRM